MTPMHEFVQILEAKIKRLEAALADRNAKIEGLQRVLDGYRAERRGRMGLNPQPQPGGGED